MELYILWKKNSPKSPCGEHYLIFPESNGLPIWSTMLSSLLCQLRVDLPLPLVSVFCLSIEAGDLRLIPKLWKTIQFILKFNLWNMLPTINIIYCTWLNDMEKIMFVFTCTITIYCCLLLQCLEQITLEEKEGYESFKLPVTNFFLRMGIKSPKI